MLNEQAKPAIDVELVERSASVIKRIETISMVIKKVDKPTWRKINGYLYTGRIQVTEQTNADSALKHFEDLENKLYLASKEARFNKHKQKLEELKSDVLALMVAFKLSV